MWTHVSDATLMDVVERTSTDDGVRAHLGRCERCGARVAEARAALGLLAEAAVPEPVPSYWDVFRRQMWRRIDSGPALRLRRPLWAAAAVASAAAVAILAVVPPRPVPLSAPATTSSVLPAWSALPPAAEDPGLVVLERVVPEVATAPATECSDVAQCVVQLTDEESRALTEALRRELEAGRTL